MSGPVPSMFDTKAACAFCGEETGWLAFRITQDFIGWVCPDCGQRYGILDSPAHESEETPRSHA